MKLLIRADGSPELGLGHLVRCLALAEEWQAQGGHAYLASVQIPQVMSAALSAAGVETRAISEEADSMADAAATRAFADEVDADWIALDGYGFGDAYQAEVKRSGRHLLALDDFGHAAHRAADLVLNQNPYAVPSLYGSDAETTRLLLGSGYALLRAHFRKWRGWERNTPDVATKLLVTLGGGATASAAPQVVGALTRSNLPQHVEVVILGASAGLRIEATREAAEQTPFQVRVEGHATDPTERMAWAEMSISAGGSTCWELAYMGVPNCVISMAENQKAVAAAVEAAGAGVKVGAPEEIDVELPRVVASLATDAARRAKMTEAGRRLVDGWGASRVVRAMRSLDLRLRPATLEDRELLWRWRNEPEVRAQSFRTDEIPWEEHVRWFDRALANPDCLIWICTDPRGTAIGQGRFVIADGEGEISVSLDSAFRGRGYGVMLLEALTDRLFAERPDATVVRAWVKRGNDASKRAFEAAGYRLSGEEATKGMPAWLYSRSRDDYPPTYPRATAQEETSG